MEKTEDSKNVHAATDAAMSTADSHKDEQHGTKTNDHGIGLNEHGTKANELAANDHGIGLNEPDARAPNEAREKDTPENTTIAEARASAPFTTNPAPCTSLSSDRKNDPTGYKKKKYFNKNIFLFFKQIKLTTKLILFILTLSISFMLVFYSVIPVLRQATTSTQINFDTKIVPSLLIGKINDLLAENRFCLLRHISSQKPDEMSDLEDQMNTNRDKITQSLKTFFTLSGEPHNSKIITLLEEFNKSNEKITQESSDFSKDNALKILNNENMTLFKRVISSFDTLQGNAVNHIKEGNIELKNNINNSIIKTIILCLSMTLLLQLLSVLFARRIVNPLKAIMKAGQSVADDNIHIEVPFLSRKDEVGDIARTFHMIKEKTVSAMRAQSGLNCMSGGMMIFDEAGHYIFANPACVALVAKFSDVFEAHFKIRKIATILTPFHVSAFSVFIQEDLTQLKTPYSKKITLNNLTFQIVANPVYDQKHQRIGLIMEWSNLTDELKIQNEVENLVKAAVAGNFGERLMIQHKSGFMLNLSVGINSLLDTIQMSLGDIDLLFKELSEGQLDSRLDKDYSGLFETIKKNANQTLNQFSDTINSISVTSSHVSEGIKEIYSGTQTLASRTQQQVNSLQQAADTIKMVAGTVKSNADDAKQADALASNAHSIANNGGSIVNQAMEAMKRIKDSSDKITDIASVINDIAFQTNLLALNASIEAARAGEAGRGFAVVAEEVRHLSHQTAASSKAVSEIIMASGLEVASGVSLVNKAGETLKQVVQEAQKVAQIVQNIADASVCQAESLDEINHAMDDIDSLAQQNNFLVEQSASIAQQLQQDSHEMSKQIQFFQ